MKKDSFKTDVIFRKNKTDNSIEAFLLYDIATLGGDIICYSHIRRPSAACRDYFLNNTIPAKEKQYQRLKKEMEDLGYNFHIIQKRKFGK